VLIKYFLSILLLFTITRGAFDRMEAGAGPLAMGKACVAMQNLPFAIYYNPANISDNNLQLSLDYQNYYGIKDLNRVNLVFNLPIKRIPTSFAVSSFGNTIYREMQLMMAGAYRIASTLAFGVSLQYYHCSIKGYGSQSTWGINMGVAYELLDRVRIGSQVTNLNQPVISNVREKLPQTFSVGISYQAGKLFMLNMEFFRDTNFDQEYRFGLDYSLSSYFNIRAGIIDRLNNYSGGCALSLDKVSFEYALVIHQTLGASHITSLLISL
jgi:hypothetical protein